MINLYVGDVRIEISGEVSMSVEGERISIQTSKGETKNPYIIHPDSKKSDQKPLSDLYTDTPPYMTSREAYMKNAEYLDGGKYLKIDHEEHPPLANEPQREDTKGYKNSSYTREGATALRGLVETWSINLGVEGTQPNRQEALLDCIQDTGMAMMYYVDCCGGLTKAIIDCWEGDQVIAREIAMNMAQVSSIIYPPLSQKLELFYKTV